MEGSEGPDHDGDLADKTRVIESQDIDSFGVEFADPGLEQQSDGVVAEELGHIGEVLPDGQYWQDGRTDDGQALERTESDGAPEGDVGRQR